MTAAPPARPVLPAFAVGPVAVMAGGLAVVLTLLSGRYGYHRDELYFLVAGRHPAWGYVDQPPLTPALARASTEFFGNSPTGLRVVATLAAVGMVVTTALIVRELGGWRAPQVLGACCAAASGFVLAVGHMVSTATFDLLAWLVLSWLALRLLRTRDGRWWIAIGALVGFSLLNKNLVVLLLTALLVAVLAIGPREILRSRWLAAGIAIALLVAAPNLWWQANHGWPQLTVAGGISSDDGVENRIMFVPLQLLQHSPLLVPVWVAGLLRLLRDPAVRWARPVAVAYPVLCLLVVAIGGKSYYALPLLIVLTAAGCEPVLGWVRRGGGLLRRGVMVAGVVLAGVTSALATLPVLPTSSLGLVNGINAEQGEQVGWPQLVAAVDIGWRGIPSEQRGRAVIFTSNYGQAGAIARFGAGHGLPAPYSGHMSFADWGPPPDSSNGPVLVVQQAGTGGLEQHFTGCHQVEQVDNRRGVDNEEQGARITLCSGTTRPWSALWPTLRRFY